MRILFLSSVFPQPNAPVRGIYLLQVCKALSTQHEVKAIVPRSWRAVMRGLFLRNEQVLGSTLDRDYIEVDYPCYFYAPGVFRGLHAGMMWASIHRRVRRMAARFRPDCILSYWIYPDGAAAIRAARWLGIPVVVMVGGSDILVIPRNAASRRRTLKVLRSADAVITVGADLKSKCVGLGVEPNKVHIVPNGIDKSLFVPGDRCEARRRLRIPIHARVLLWVGRMHPVKGLDVLLAACQRLRSQNVAFYLYLVGGGPLRPELERESQTRALSDVITFVGEVLPQHLPDWYQAADVTVLPSRSEGVPNVLRESLACGTPFVASRVGDIPQFARDLVDLLVPPEDANALAAALEQALARPSSPVPPPAQFIGWNESAELLMQVLQPLVAEQPANRKWPTVSSQRWRQVARKAMAAMLPRRRFLVCGPASSKSLCLTFDDGPHPEYTPRLLDALNREGIQATFFVIGKNAERFPDLVRRIADEGHSVGHHSFHHTDPAQTSARQLCDEVERTRELLAKLLGQKHVLFRPPHGKITIAKLWRLWRAGQTVVLWNADPKDYTCKDANEVRAWFQTRPPQAGDIVLLHDNRPYATEVLPEIARAVRNQNLDFTTIPQWTT